MNTYKITFTDGFSVTTQGWTAADAMERAIDIRDRHPVYGEEYAAINGCTVQ